ncbi:hypothetical protein [Variovorax guangxiensis]|uniref:hypothetical protein n=1 Tax=Variovorax guangxiensis TaxID=1775474 RepID=UPI002864F084|nr:hypothetical protein [Variovorax guangxiensis]MDR6854167.1 hypothetical protein [Variovorax guangxiensis]
MAQHGSHPLIAKGGTTMSNELRRKLQELQELQELSNNAPDPATRAIIEAVRFSDRGAQRAPVRGRTATGGAAQARRGPSPAVSIRLDQCAAALRLRVAAAFLAEAERCASVRPAEAAPPYWPPLKLTPGTDSAMPRYPDADAFARMFKTGNRPDGTPIKVMPFGSLGQMNDTDVRALFLYLKSLAPG